jgi:peptidoglycan hydrolase-like protein with peptidoglycan-binding domain
MSFDRAHAHGSHGKAPAGAHAAPGKHTQVDVAGGGQAGNAVQLRAHAAAQAETSRAHHEEAEAVAAAKANPSGVNMATLQHFIAKHEGYVDHVYLDSRGFPTAGIGHLLPRGRYHVGQKISAAQITEWFKDDVAEAIEGAKQDLGSEAYGRLNEARKMVVIDMVFNLGTAGFGQFHATIHSMRTGAFAQAATHMLQSLWASQVGNRAREDAAIMRSGHLAGGNGDHDDAPDDHGHATTLADVRDGRAVLKKGSRGPAVAKVQNMLHVPDDGIFGNQTLHAVEKFQRTHHLTADSIVGRHTLEALEDKPHAKPKPKADAKPKAHAKPRDDDDDTGGVRAPDGDGRDHDDDRDEDDRASHGKWSRAPSLEAVKSGSATLHKGEQGPAVKHVQRLLSVDVDGKFGPDTREAVIHFQREHHEHRHDGVIDAHTLAVLAKHPVGSIEGETRQGAAQRHKMLSIARAGSVGRRPDGRCYYHVCQFLVQCGGYGKIKNPYTQFPAAYLPEAHHFADLMNSRGPAHFGLDRISISNPYDAPAGSIVVVAAGSPGTAHPTAGDIAVADGHDQFYNGGMMGYSGRAGWAASPRARLLGCYIPR